MLTQERADILTKFLSSDVAVAEEILNAEPAEALAKINANGYDFSIDELNDYARALKLAKAAEGELSSEDLDDVSGGFGLGAALLCVGGGVVLGVACNVKW